MSKKDGRLSLAFRDIEELHPRIVEKFQRRVVDLDLSNNRISNIDALKSFELLETLVLDKNAISSHTKFPPMPRLRTLWVNHNNITNLSVFIDKLVVATPNLRYLSMLGNDACPNFLNQGTLAQYNDYRKYVIQRMQMLTQLDADPVTEEERQEARKIYGSLPTTVAKDEEERAREAREQEERDLARIQKEKEAKEKRKEELKQKKLKRLELQRQKREAAAKREAGQGALSLSKSDKAQENKSAVDMLPTVDEEKVPAQKGVPLLLADPTKDEDEPPLPPPDLAGVEALTDEDDWSDESSVDESLYSAEPLLLAPGTNKQQTSTTSLDSDDEGWE